MSIKTRKIFPLLFFLSFFLCLQNIHAFDIDITGKEAGVYFKGEYNRSFYWYGDISIIGAVELNNKFTFKGGFLYGKTNYDTDIKAFTGARFDPWADKPLNLSLSYIYNGLPEYEVHSHTILPVISYNAKWAGIGVGTSFRFTSFFGEPAVFESLLSFSGYVNFINNEKLRLGISCANFSDFHAGNMGSYSLGLNSVIHINRKWSVINDFELMQSGSTGLSATFYGISWRGGMKFTW